MSPWTRCFILASSLLVAACSSTPVDDFPVRLVVPESDPSEVDAVVFLLGDAGRTEPGRSPVLAQLAADVEHWSAALARDSAVSVAYLGDIVYPDGVHERGHPEFPRDSVRLWNQIEVVAGPAALEHKSLGLFLTGNHDWGNMTGDEAIRRALNLRAEIDSARAATGARVALLPAVEHPGPVIRDLRNNVRLIFVDTHWWIQERSEQAKSAFFERMEEAITTSVDREVILLAHHPWASAGPHGVVASGTRSIGLLYLLSKSGVYAQDVNSPAHGDFRDRLRAAFSRAGKVPLVYAAGHDHSLQVLEGRSPGDPRHILISGSGSKLSSIQDTVSLRYGAVKPGYMTLIFRRDDSVDLFVNAGAAQYLECPEDLDDRSACMAAAADSFNAVFSDRILTASEADGDSTGAQAADTMDMELDAEEREELEDAQAPPAAVPTEEMSIYGDSVVATPGQSYAAGSIHRWFLGDLNRDLWDIPFKAAVLNLDAVGGSLEPDELSGGRQTLGLKFDGADGRTYQFRSIVKNASRAIPSALRSGPIDDALQDQMAAQFPLSAMVVAELLEAAGILVAKPRPVVMPDDPRLGEYRELFAGRMGWIEERPNEEDGDRPGFAGSERITGTEALYEELREDPESYVDDDALLRARLIDLFVGDWDRHYDNWRWASYADGDRTRWEPIPRDRDWALARIDGLVPAIARIYYPKYVGFGPDYPSIKRLTWAAQNFDRRLLNQKDREDFLQAAAELKQAFSDPVLERAVGVLPEPYRNRIGDRLLSDLRSRRDLLDEAAAEFHELLSAWVDVRGTEEGDYVTVRGGANASVHVQVRSGEADHVTFDRTFVAEYTDEVRLYLLDGDDIVEFEGPRLPIRLKIVGGDGDDLVVVRGQQERRISGRPFSIGSAEVFSSDPAPVDLAGLDDDDAEEVELAGERPTLVWDHRDWGREWIPVPAADYASEFGLHIGASVTRRGFGFRADPFANELSVTVMGASSPRRLVAEVEYLHRLTSSGWFIGLEGRALTQRLTRFFGLGNESTNDLPEESYETRRSLRNVDATISYRPFDGPWQVWAGPRVRRWGRTDDPSPRVFELFPITGSEPTTLVGGILGGLRDTRDDPVDTRAGSWVRAEFATYPALADVETPWSGATLEARRYLATDAIPGAPALHLAAFAQSVSSDAPYFERASLGGKASLPGFRTGRFRGDHALSTMALLRAEVLSFSTALGGFDLGVHGVGTTGRVWLDGEESNRWHTGGGGGLWVRSRPLDRLFSVTLASAERGPRTYLTLGFPF